MNSRVLLRVACFALGLLVSIKGQAATPEPFVSCFEAVETDAMRYVTASVAKKLLTREQDRQYDDLRVTLKLDRTSDGRVSNAVFLKKSSIDELNDISKKIALESTILCPRAPDTTQVVDVIRWSMHLSADESSEKINGTAIPDRMITNFRNHPERPADGHLCEVERSPNGVAISADCTIEGVCYKVSGDEVSYPRDEYRRGVYGRTRIFGRVGEDGKIVSRKVTHSSGNSRLDYVAVNAFNSYRFACKGPNPDRKVRAQFDFGKPSPRP